MSMPSLAKEFTCRAKHGNDASTGQAACRHLGPLGNLHWRRDWRRDRDPRLVVAASKLVQERYIKLPIQMISLSIIQSQHHTKRETSTSTAMMNQARCVRFICSYLLLTWLARLGSSLSSFVKSSMIDLPSNPESAKISCRASLAGLDSGTCKTFRH